MSKLGYLLTILALCVIGYGLSTQLFLATRTTRLLITAETVQQIGLYIKQARTRLLRFPNSDDEFETMVLGHIKMTRFSGAPLVISRFTPGSRMTPASFDLILKETAVTNAVTIRLEYFGCEFEANPFLKGVLRKR